MNSIFFPLVFLFAAQISCATTTTDLGMPCADAKVQKKRSVELQKIAAEDQADRDWQIKGLQPTQEMECGRFTGVVELRG